MKLNPDCIRDILLTVEENCDFHHILKYQANEPILEKLSSYSHEEILYHIRQCSLNNFITGVKYYDAGDNVFINDLTPKGHEFLENIRDDNNWNKIKHYAKNIGSSSLDVLSQIAANVITALIKSQFSNL